MGCESDGTWITEYIAQPVEQFLESAENFCEEISEWVEEEIREPVERRRTTQERRCRRRPCQLICACCNKWFCWIEVVVEIIIEWVIKVVGEWLLRTVCKYIVKIVKIVVMILVVVTRFVAHFFGCLFLDFPKALLALGDLWFGLVDIIHEVGDFYVFLLDAVSDLLDLTSESILDLGEQFSDYGRFFFGLIAGLLDIVRGIVDGIAQFVDGIFEVISGVLSLDFCRALEGLTRGIGFGLLQALTNALNVFSLGARGVLFSFGDKQLNNWLRGELEEKYSRDPERLAELEQILQIDSSSFGINWQVVPFICSISSLSDISLRELHEAGELNLFEIAGYAQIWCQRPLLRSDWQLVYKNTGRRVSLVDLGTYLDDQESVVPEFELLAGSRDALRDLLVVSERKFRCMGIHLKWGTFQTIELQTRGEMEIGGNLDDFITRITIELRLSDICTLPAGFVFTYSPDYSGLANVFWRGSERKATGATVRAGTMNHVYGTVLAHEMGHCFSLCHAGHDGVEHIMFTKVDVDEDGNGGGNNCGITDLDILDEHRISEVTGDLEVVTFPTVVSYLLIHGEPVFSWEDGRNSWRWILNEGEECLPA